MDKPIEDFEVPAGDELDHFAMIDLDLVADNAQFKACLEQGAAKATIAGKVYARVGMQRITDSSCNTGTLLDRAMFLPFYEKYGQVMLDEAAWAQLVMDNPQAEGID